MSHSFDALGQMYNFRTGAYDTPPPGPLAEIPADWYEDYIPRLGQPAEGAATIMLYRLYVEGGDPPSEAYIKVMRRCVGDA